MSIIYPQVISSGTTTLGTLIAMGPSNSIFNWSTDSEVSGEAIFLFTFPATISEADFANVLVYFVDSSGVPIDMTISSGPYAPDYQTRTVCGSKSTYSPAGLWSMAEKPTKEEEKVGTTFNDAKAACTGKDDHEICGINHFFYTEFKCVKKCAGDFYSRDKDCECTCKDGSAYCPTSGECFPKCGQGGKVRTWVGGPNCYECKCPKGQEECKGACYSECTGGKVRDGNCDCVCPEGKVPCDNNCIPAACEDPGKIRDQSNLCNCICIKGTACDNGNCLSCPQNKKLDPAECRCVCDPENTNGFRVCDNGECLKCGFGANYDLENCECKCNPDQDPCVKDGLVVCRPKCPDPQVRSSDCETCECPESLCPGTNQKVVKNSENGCECECKDACETNKVWSNPPTDCYCVCNDQLDADTYCNCKGSTLVGTCESPKKWKKTSVSDCACVCPPLGKECPNGVGKWQNTNTCKCECIRSGDEECGGACYAPCPEGQTRNQNTCVCDCDQIIFGGETYTGTPNGDQCSYKVVCWRCGDDAPVRQVATFPSPNFSLADIKGKNCSDFGTDPKYNTEQEAVDKCCLKNDRCETAAGVVCCKESEGKKCEDGECKKIPTLVWMCKGDNQGCVQCYNDFGPGPWTNPGGDLCSKIIPNASAEQGGTEADCNILCAQDVTYWMCGSGGCYETKTVELGGSIPLNGYSKKQDCDLGCPTPPPPVPGSS